MKFNVAFTILFLFSFSFSQEISTFKFASKTLNEERNISIFLPESFHENDSVNYPMILCLDGEYLFYSIVGAAQNLMFRGLIPETIIIGIDQNEKVKDNYTQRWFDCDYDYKTADLKNKGINFHDFIENELYSFLKEKYRIDTFSSIAGHSLTANYVNYFLKSDVFKGFVSISPYIPNSFESIIKNNLSESDKDKFYYLSTSDNDLSGHISQIKRQEKIIFSKIENKKFHFDFKNYLGETHMSLPERSALDAVSHLFSAYVPLYTLNNEKELKSLKNPIEYLFTRYDKIKEIYGVNIEIREDDFSLISYLLESQKMYSEMEKLSAIWLEKYPKSSMAFYAYALVLEKQKDFYKALEYYKKGYDLLGPDIINKNDFYVDIERLEKKLKLKKEAN